MCSSVITATDARTRPRRSRLCFPSPCCPPSDAAQTLRVRSLKGAACSRCGLRRTKRSLLYKPTSRTLSGNGRHCWSGSKDYSMSKNQFYSLSILFLYEKRGQMRPQSRSNHLSSNFLPFALPPALPPPFLPPALLPRLDSSYLSDGKSLARLEC